MPRYYFNIFDGYSELDDTGTELPDIYTAQTEAVRLTGEVIRDMGAKFWNGEFWRLEVTDEQANVLFVLRFCAEDSPLPTPPSYTET